MDQHKKDKIKARELDERITKIEKFLWSESGYAAGGIPSESSYNIKGAHDEAAEGEAVPVSWSSDEASRKAREGAEAASDRGAVVDPGAWERLGEHYRNMMDKAEARAVEAEQQASLWQFSWLAFVKDVTGDDTTLSMRELAAWIKAKENTVKLDVDGRVHQTVAAKGDDRAGEGRAVAKLPEARNP